MTRRDLLPPFLFVVLAALWATGVAASGRLLLPRDPAAAPPGAGGLQPAPYGADGRAAAAAAEPFNWWMTDPVNLLVPDLAVAADALLRGRAPLWNSGVLCGVPHAANPITATFYPPTWIVLRAPPVAAPLLLATFHLALAATLFFAWMRSLDVGRGAASVGAVAFALSGWMTGRLFNFVVVDVVVWLPLGLCGVERVLAGRPRTGAAAIGVALAMMLLAGFPQLAILGGLAVGVYAGVGLAARAAREPRAAARGGGVALAGAALGLVLAAPLLVPAATLRRDSERGRDGAAAVAGSGFPAGAFVGLASPDLLGGPYEKPPAFTTPEDGPAERSRLLAARLLLGDRGADGVARLDGAPSGSELAIAPGAVVLLLAPFALLRRGRRPTVGLLLLLVLGAGYATKALAPPVGLAHALGLDVGGPLRGVVVFAFVPAALFAFAVDAALRDGRARAIAGGVALLVAPFLLAALAAWAAPDATYGALVRLLRAHGADRLLEVPATLALGDAVAALRPSLDVLRRDVSILAFGGAAAAAALGLLRRPSMVVAALAVVVAGELGVRFADRVRPVRAADPYPETPALRHLRDRLGDARFARVAATDAEALADVHRLLPPNCGLLHGLRDAQGYREPAPARTLAWFRGLAAGTATAGTSGFSLKAAASPALDLAGIKFFLATRALEGEADFAASGLRRVALAETLPGDAVVYENLDVLPRAVAVPRTAEALRVVDDAEAVRRLRGGAYDPRIAADLAPDAGAPPQVPVAASRPTGSPPPEVAVVADRPGDATLRSRSADGCVVVWTEAWDPGWRVTIDDGPESVPLRAAGLFLAAEAPPGERTLRFVYAPPGARTARRLLPWAAAALVGGAALAWFVRRRTSSRRAEADGAEGVA